MGRPPAGSFQPAAGALGGVLMQTVSPKEGRDLVLSGRAPDELRVSGHLNLASLPVTRLPAYLEVDSLDLSGCTQLGELPDGLKVRRINLTGCTGLRALPQGFSCYELEMRQTWITRFPDGVRVEYRLNLEDNALLATLPEDLSVGTLILRNCASLKSLPEGLSVYYLDISGCSRLSGWPRCGEIRFGRLTARNCTGLTDLPPWLTRLAQLDLRGCVGIGELPEGLRVDGWVDLAGTQVRRLPESLRGVQLRWRGVRVDERIVFQPESITPDEVLNERNVEVRRVLLERVGFEAFIQRAHGHVVDQDTDPGGIRQLVRVPLPDDEPLVCLSVRCPSTARRYIIRVPPDTRSCRHAAAWIAGFDDPDEYRPLVET